MSKRIGLWQLCHPTVLSVGTCRHLRCQEARWLVKRPLGWHFVAFAAHVEADGLNPKIAAQIKQEVNVEMNMSVSTVGPCSGPLASVAPHGGTTHAMRFGVGDGAVDGMTLPWMPVTVQTCAGGQGLLHRAHHLRRRPFFHRLRHLRGREWS